jgi:hypothetical protein
VTGVGETKDDPLRLAYPVRTILERRRTVSPRAQRIKIVQGSNVVASLDCAGAWVLLKGAPGNYRVDASSTGSLGQARPAPFRLGAGAQKRIVLRFPTSSRTSSQSVSSRTTSSARLVALKRSSGFTRR